MTNNRPTNGDSQPGRAERLVAIVAGGYAAGALGPVVRTTACTPAGDLAVQAALVSLATPPDVCVADYTEIGLSGADCPEHNEMRGK